ncbi:MAG: X2-like carbohydrate binding domain-containing protein, partial [Oscillospiraceae bacterium]
MKKIASYFFASVIVLNMICTAIPSQLVYAGNVQNSTSAPTSEPTSTPTSEPTSAPTSEPTSTPDSKAKDATQPAPAAPSGYTLGKTKEAISQSETARVYVNNSLPKTVIENFTYSLSSEDTAKATVDADGNISVKEGYSPVAGDSITVNVGIEYYQGDSVLFYDSLDDDETKFTKTAGKGSGSYVKNDINPHSGTKSAHLYNKAGGGDAYLSADLGAEYNGTLTYWFYDAKTYGVMLKEGFGFSPSATKPVINMFGFDQEASDSASPYKIRAGSTWSNISVSREKGWKKIQFVANGTNTKAYIDGAEVHTFTAKTIRYPMLFNAWPGGTPDNYVFDDVSFVSENATLISETLSTTVSLTATAHTLPKTEFDYNKVTKAKVSVEVLPSAANLKAVQCNQTALTAEQYEVVGKNVNILPAYLDTLTIGKHTFTLLLGNESKDININVIDNVKVAQNTYSFCTSTESSEYKDVSIAFELNGNTFTDVKYNNSSVEKANYSFNNGALVLTKEFLATLAVGSHTFEATFDKSEPVQIDIGVFAATINITANLSAINVKLNAPINFAVEAQVSPAGDAISYQWFVCDDANKTNAAPVAGETAKNYNIAQAKISVHNGKYYYCKLSANGAADAFTDVVLVTVTSDSITSLPQPTTLILKEDGTVSYSLVENAV